MGYDSILNLRSDHICNWIFLHGPDLFTYNFIYIRKWPKIHYIWLYLFRHKSNWSWSKTVPVWWYPCL